MTDDPALRTLYRGILRHPADDVVRLAYAARLDELGAHAVARLIRVEVADPARTRTLAGARAGIPDAVRVSFRRGLPDQVTVARAVVPTVGHILRDHPIRVVRVAGCDRAVHLFPGAFPPPAGPGAPVLDWGWLGTICPTCRRGARVAGLDPGSTTTWATRDAMVGGVGAWADALLPPCPGCAAE